MKPTEANMILLMAMQGICVMLCPMLRLLVLQAHQLKKKTKTHKPVFGKYVDIYDIQQAVEDKATVRIFYESRLAKIEFDEEEQKIIDQRIEEVTEEEELTERQQRICQMDTTGSHCRK